ncbi:MULTISPECIES: hypothetical protein [unclassified Lacinutrix]
MDELELLKKDWKKEDTKRYPKLSYNEIYSMILKKSSSIVKWIFIISILEFVFWIAFSLLMKANGKNDNIADIESSTVFITLSIISYAVLAYFFYKFYMNYKTINSTDNASILMENILKTRRTVKQYVGFNLAFLIVSFIVMTPYVINHDEHAMSLIENATANGHVFKFYAGLILGILLVLIVTIAVLLLFYYLVYGILLKRLNRNYKELKKLEI